MSERDTQRSRVYKAEWAIGAWKQEIPNNQLQTFVDFALDKRAIRARWGARKVWVKLGRNGGHGNYHQITLGVKARNSHIICHELAHSLMPDKFADHGPEYCGVYLFIANVIIGTEFAKQLRASFKANKVKVNRKAIPPIASVVVDSRSQCEREEKQRAKADAIARIRKFIEAGTIGKAEAKRVIDNAKRKEATK